MVRDLYGVREVPGPQDPVPLTEEEERRCRAAFLVHIGEQVARQGWATFPAYTPAERARLLAVGRELGERWGRTVHVTAVDICSMRFTLADGIEPENGH
ncbi:hypothetical protein [Streptomyces sp. MP131-18]|uniref:hypothetical protein n=1 Tax=Streptomyces sp. MP131-18 TaxID=1857892 RepID=UPI00097C41C9|nr:hypothetical protein [Streptomyces sp. MP131-18]ONK15476.1 hypothetical protein STBA_62930 [Streptomyces sp. MP131-18]